MKVDISPVHGVRTEATSLARTKASEFNNVILQGNRFSWICTFADQIIKTPSLV
jgi:hypothetical protein